MEGHLKLYKNSEFEPICQGVVQNGEVIFGESDKSCGLTMRCFAAMFLSKSQITYPKISHVIDGSPLSQLCNNPNILLYSLRMHWYEKLLSRNNFTRYNEETRHEKFHSWANSGTNSVIVLTRFQFIFNTTLHFKPTPTLLFVGILSFSFICRPECEKIIYIFNV